VEIGILKREWGVHFGLDQKLEGNQYYREEKIFLEKKSETVRTRITASLLGEGGKGSRGEIVDLSLTITKNFVGGKEE